MSLLNEFSNWMDSLPEPIALLLLSAVLFTVTIALRRVSASPERSQESPLVRRRMGSATGRTVQRGRTWWAAWSMSAGAVSTERPENAPRG